MAITLDGTTGITSPGGDVSVSQSLSGNLTFTGTGNRITGDFSNATLASRVAFQTSTANGNTTINAIPNGTGTASQFVAHMGSDPANASRAGININSASSAALIFSDITGTGTYLPMTFYTGGSERMRIDTSGNVGIGTTSPDFKLEVVGGTNNGVHIKDAESATVYGGLFTQASALALVARSNHALTFGTNDTERARITSAGKFLFNTTTQNGNEQVGMVYSSNAGVGFSIQDSNAQSGNTFIQFKNGATVAGTITSNGTTTMTYGSASDYRLKSNPQPIQNAIATVAALNPVSFIWNQTGEEGVGFIAHEVQAVLPDCVVGQKDAEDENGNPLYQMIDTGSASLIATLTAAIQELKAINDTQASRIETLEAKVAALEAK